MVCESCKTKLGKVSCPEVWKGDEMVTTPSGGATTTSTSSPSASKQPKKSSGREVNENKLLSSKRKERSAAATADRMQPYQRRCKICKGRIQMQGAYYCQGCSYKKGICPLCGKKVLDTTMYRQSSA